MHEGHAGALSGATLQGLDQCSRCRARTPYEDPVARADGSNGSVSRPLSKLPSGGVGQLAPPHTRRVTRSPPPQDSLRNVGRSRPGPGRSPTTAALAQRWVDVSPQLLRWRIRLFQDAKMMTRRLTRRQPITVQKITGIVRSVIAPHPASRGAAAPRTSGKRPTVAVASSGVSWCAWGHCPSVTGRNAGLCQRQVGWARGRRDRRCCARHVGLTHIN